MAERTAEDEVLPLATAIHKAIDEHGLDVATLAWEQAKTFLPVFEVVVWVENVRAHAVLHGVRREDIFDAIALLGYLRRSADEHSAWLAAELLRKHCQNPQNFMAAAMATTTQPH